MKFADPRVLVQTLAAQRQRARTEEHYQAPLNPTEQTLSAIWSNLLGIDNISRSDHFFQAGGHSLLATQMLARVRDASGVELPLKAVFESPVLAEFAARVESAVAAVSVETNT
jgi:hypothetical protein